MNGKRKFKIKTYFKYLLISPWTETISLPNLRTLVWISIIVSLALKLKWPLFISIGIALMQYFWNEYKSGYHINWYRNRRYGEQRKALKKIRKERKERQVERYKQNEIEQPKPLNS